MTNANTNGIAFFAERRETDGFSCTAMTYLWLGNRREVRRPDDYPGHRVLARLIDLCALPFALLRLHVLTVPRRGCGAFTRGRFIFLGGHVVDAFLLHGILAVPLDRIWDVRNAVLARLPRVCVGLHARS